jgi:hypothetical protein
MKTATLAVGFALLLSFAAATACAQSAGARPAIAIVGGTLIDVSNSGHSTHDIPNADTGTDAPLPFDGETHVIVAAFLDSAVARRKRLNDARRDVLDKRLK